MGTYEEEGERNLEHFQGQKLPWLRTFLQERGIQISSEARVIIMEMLGLHNSYPRRFIPADLRVWLERVYLLEI